MRGSDVLKLVRLGVIIDPSMVAHVVVHLGKDPYFDP